MTPKALGAKLYGAQLAAGHDAPRAIGAAGIAAKLPVRVGGQRDGRLVLEQLHQPRPWQTQSRACRREPQTQKEMKTRQKNNNHQPTSKALQVLKNICQAKSQGSSAASLDDTEPQRVTLPPLPSLGCRAGEGAGARTRASPGTGSDGRLCPCGKGCGFTLPGRERAVPERGCGTRGAARGLWSTSASRLAPAASPRVHLVCVFLQSTLPAGYVRGEECRATLCHEIRLTFLG